MIFRPYHYFDTGCAAYLFGCGTLGRCVVVDPQERDVEEYMAFAASKRMRITHVVDTHVHADHRSGGPALADRAGAAYCLHSSAPTQRAFQSLADGEEIDLGNTRVRVLHTPGHTAESISLVVSDLRRGPEPWFVLTGDTLFIGAVGRPDLPGRTKENAGELYSSLHERLLLLPDDVEVYPGHFSGSVCGAGMSGKPSSTIAAERRWNPMLRMSRDALVSELGHATPKPADMDEVLRFNRGRSG